MGKASHGKHLMVPSRIYHGTPRGARRQIYRLLQQRKALAERVQRAGVPSAAIPLPLLACAECGKPMSVPWHLEPDFLCVEETEMTTNIGR